MAKIIGIDLGTTNSVVAVMQGGEPIVIPTSEGERLCPSVVAVNKNGERLVGRTARNQAVINPENTIYSIKRLMGRKYDDPEVQRTISRVPYKITKAPNGDAQVVLGGKSYSPPEISAMILAKLKADAEAYLGETVTQAVITVPAYFNDAQRNATKDAGRIAGLEVLRIINEPTASSLAYGLDKTDRSEVIAVYDLGGGTFDVSILDVGEGAFQVRSTSGDTFLGGDDFDQRVMDYLLETFNRENNMDLTKDRQAMQRLREASEKAKIELSSTMQSEINLPYLTADATGPKHLVMTMTRSKLEQLTDDLITRSMEPCRKALQDAGISKNKVDEVVLVGGMTRMPAVQEAVKKEFGREPHRGVNPDEVVAVGAAIQAGVLGGQVNDVILLDVTPLTLSIETLGGVATPIIQRNTTVPTRASQVFSTATDNQTQVEIHVVQGERSMAADNKSLGKFILDGIPPAPRGMPQIEVKFDIDSNGILEVTAMDKATNRSQKITITASSGLTEAEIEKMRKEAEAHAEEDAKRKESIETRNQAESLAYSAEKALRDAGDKVPVDVRTEIEASVKTVRDKLAANDTDAIKKAMDDLSQKIQKIGEAMYQQPGQGGPQGEPGAGFAGGSGNADDEDVVEGEFTE
ncbi:MAG: molecular chaperone DnaK [Anaerolineae bacterium]|nr:molecular chaperone DnaK [Anaerolineae bacterium]